MYTLLDSHVAQHAFERVNHAHTSLNTRDLWKTCDTRSRNVIPHDVPGMYLLPISAIHSNIAVLTCLPFRSPCRGRRGRSFRTLGSLANILGQNIAKVWLSETCHWPN